MHPFIINSWTQKGGRTCVWHGEWRHSRDVVSITDHKMWLCVFTQSASTLPVSLHSLIIHSFTHHPFIHAIKIPSSSSSFFLAHTCVVWLRLNWIRRKGIGNLLHSKLEEWFISNGARYIDLLVCWSTTHAHTTIPLFVEWNLSFNNNFILLTRLSYGFLAEGNTASAQLFERNGFTKMAVPIQLLGMFVQNIAKEVPSYVLDQVKERADIEQAAQLIGEYWKGSAFVPFPEDLHKMLSSPHCFGPFIVSSQGITNLNWCTADNSDSKQV